MQYFIFVCLFSHSTFPLSADSFVEDGVNSVHDPLLKLYVDFHNSTSRLVCCELVSRRVLTLAYTYL